MTFTFSASTSIGIFSSETCSHLNSPPSSGHVAPRCSPCYCCLVGFLRTESDSGPPPSPKGFSGLLYLVDKNFKEAPCRCKSHSACYLTLILSLISYSYTGCTGHSKVPVHVSDIPHRVLGPTILPPQSTFSTIFLLLFYSSFKIGYFCWRISLCLFMPSPILFIPLGMIRKQNKIVLYLPISLDWAVGDLCPWHQKQYCPVFLRVGSAGPLSESPDRSKYSYSWALSSTIGYRESEFLIFK